MDFAFSPADERFRQELRAWLAANRPARAERVPHDDASLAAEVAFLRDWQQRLHVAGYVGLLWPREYGGRGARPTQQAILNQELARARAPQLLNRVGVNNTGPTLIAHGSEAQKRRFLPPILSAEELWCQLFSEPGAGSDLAALRTRAEPDGDGFVVSGQKVWTSYAQFSRWAIAMTTLAHERGTGFAFKEQVLQRIAVEDLVRLARAQGRAGDPVVRQEIARGWIEVALMGLMNCRTLTRLERGEEPGPESSLVKLFWASLTQRLHQLALELEGSYAGLVAGSPHAVGDGRWQQAFLWSRVGAIAGGTSEVQANIIAQRILGLP